MIHQFAAMTEQGLAMRIGKHRAREQSRDSAHEIAAMAAQAVAGSREAGLSRQGFSARIQDPTKNWKFDAGDLAKRERWDDYMEAYTAVLERTSTEWAPWHVIPADRKWLRNYLVTAALAEPGALQMTRVARGVHRQVDEAP